MERGTIGMIVILVSSLSCLDMLKFQNLFAFLKHLVKAPQLLDRGASDSVLYNLRNTCVANNAYLRASQLAQSVACHYVPTHLRCSNLHA